MRDAPDAATLLALAATFDGEASMAPLVACARAIVRREEASGADAYAGLRAECDALCGEAGEGLASLARDIRAGRFDAPGPARDRMLRFLLRLARRKLAEANPEFLREESGNYL